MEFETADNSTGTSGVFSDISDAQRLAASTRRVELEPLHTDVVPDDMSDEYIAGRHEIDAPVANAENDIEATHWSNPQSTQNKLTPRHHMVALGLGIPIGLALIGAAIYAGLPK